MGAVDTTYTFTATDTITSAKMNNIIDQTTITTDAIIGTTLDVASGKLKIRSQGITSNEMGTNSVVTTAITDSNITTAKIADANVTTAKILDANITTAKILDAAITAPKLSGAQTGTAPIYGVRAWVNFDATRNSSGGSDSANTNRFIRASGNVTSVLKNADGDFTINFTTAMPDLNYAVSATTAPLNGRFISLYEGGTLNTGSADAGLTTGSVRIAVHAGTTISTDPDVVTLMVVR